MNSCLIQDYKTNLFVRSITNSTDTAHNLANELFIKINLKLDTKIQSHHNNPTDLIN